MDSQASPDQIDPKNAENAETAGADEREPQPLDVYHRLAADCRAERGRLARWDTAVVWARLLIFATAAALAVGALKRWNPPSWLLVPGGLFAVLIVMHEQLLRRLRRIDTRAGLYTAGIDRIEDRWAGQGDAGDRFKDDAHLYAADLDLYGRGNLFELLSTARTAVGGATLARWLEQPAATAETTRARQAAVAELARRRDLREELALAGAAVRDDVREDSLSAWAGRPPAALPASPAVLRLGVGALGAAIVVPGALWIAGLLSPWFAVAAAVAAWLAVRRLRPALNPAIAGVERRASELGTLVAALAMLERERGLQAPALRALAAALPAEGLPASRQIARLRLLVGLLDLARNQLMTLLLAPFLWTTQLALAIELWRRAVGPAVGRWLATVGDLEALASLATFTFERPGYPFPTVVDGGPIFAAEALGHPLIPAVRRVPNDLALGGGPLRLIVVSGSNMSGKSTLLRTVGVNAVLALAGAPVCARRLTLSPVAPGATLRINDSLQAGQSRFYAELTRIKQIVTRAEQQPPMLFLLDEILHGTNSNDRRAGAQAILDGLLRRGAVGLVTTHDLALADIADALGTRAANAHFEDQLDGGVMTFDYRMKPGVVRKSNALALMRAVGLEI